MLRELRSSEMVFLQTVILDHGAHGTVQNEYFLVGKCCDALAGVHNHPLIRLTDAPTRSFTVIRQKLRGFQILRGRIKNEVIPLASPCCP